MFRADEVLRGEGVAWKAAALAAAARMIAAVNFMVVVCRCKRFVSSCHGRHALAVKFRRTGKNNQHSNESGRCRETEKIQMV